MRKNFFYAAALVLGLAFTATACSDDDDNSTVNPADIEYNSENAASWHNYMRNVAALLKQMPPIFMILGIRVIRVGQVLQLPSKLIMVPITFQVPGTV